MYSHSTQDADKNNKAEGMEAAMRPLFSQRLNEHIAAHYSGCWQVGFCSSEMQSFGEDVNEERRSEPDKDLAS